MKCIRRAAELRSLLDFRNYIFSLKHKPREESQVANGGGWRGGVIGTTLKMGFPHNGGSCRKRLDGVLSVSSSGDAMRYAYMLLIGLAYYAMGDVTLCQAGRFLSAFLASD